MKNSKRLNSKNIVMACHLSYEGILDRDIAIRMNVSEPTISRWRKHTIWQKAEEILIEKQIEKQINHGFEESPDVDQQPSR